ncbi:MAG: hypothetical protein LW690_01060 [Opitutaceae bacterium]|nr:hypothetical protein [Opitutaceae bacterium]
MPNTERLSLEAALLWATLPAEVRDRAVNHAWCRDCRQRVALAPGWSGRVAAEKLFLEGSCPRCAAPITRIIDAGTAAPPSS